MLLPNIGPGEVLRMRELITRGAVDILKLENKVYELETECKVSDADRFSVRHPVTAQR